MALIVNYLEQCRSSVHVLLFSNSNKKDKTDRLFHPLLGFKNGHKDEECSQTACDRAARVGEVANDNQ